MLHREAMGRACGALLVVLLHVVLRTTGPSAQQPFEPVGAVVLAVAFADGRVVHHVVTATPGSSWTPAFPRLSAPRSAADLLPVTAITHTHVLRDDGAVSVAVSVLRGTAREREDAIATVSVRAGAPTRVDALRSVGVAPLVLSLTALTPTTLYVPAVLNRTAGLEVVDVEVVSEPSPRYRVIVRNLSAHPAIAFRVLTYRGERLALSGLQGNKDASPIIEADGTYSFIVKPSSGTPRPGGWSPASHERIEIVAALWDDGTIEGAAGELTATLTQYVGRRMQLSHGVLALKAMPATGEPRRLKAFLAAQIASLSIEPGEQLVETARARLQGLAPFDHEQVTATLRNALADTRKGLLEDVRAAPEDAAGFSRWLGEIVTTYEAAIERFARR
jgi:hypothetical protein